MGRGKFRYFALPALLLTAAATQPGATAQRSAPPQPSMVDYLIGTWDCAHTVGNFSGTYRTSYAKVLGGKWLQQTYEFAGQKDDPASTAVALMGFDDRRQTWVRFFANSKGQYFPIRMTDTGTGWAWKYSTFFTRSTPETPGPDAMITRKSDTEYEIQGPSYPKDGVQVTEHHVCRKVSG